MCGMLPLAGSARKIPKGNGRAIQECIKPSQGLLHLSEILSPPMIDTWTLWLTEPCGRQGNGALTRTCNDQPTPTPHVAIQRTHVITTYIYVRCSGDRVI